MFRPRRIPFRWALETALGSRLTPAALLVGLAMLVLSSQALASYTTGDVFVSLGQAGRVDEHGPTGQLVRSLYTNHPPTQSAPETATGSAFDTLGNFYVTGFAANTVTEFDATGNLHGDVFCGCNSSPESIVFDRSDTAYIGNAYGTHTLFSTAHGGTSYYPAVEGKGIDWIDLASDDCTVYYTSEGHDVKRFNACTATQLSNFNTNLPGAYAFQLRLLPDGGALVADSNQVIRLNGAGTIIQTYLQSQGAADSNLFALNLDPDGQSFWTAENSGAGDVYKVNISSGQVEQHWQAGQAVTGLSVYGELDAGGPSHIYLAPSSQTPSPGGAASLTATVENGSGVPQPGVRVSFVVERGPDPGSPNTLASGAATTDGSGHATFTYRNGDYMCYGQQCNRGPASGTDTVIAVFYDSSNIEHASGIVDVSWGGTPQFSLTPGSQSGQHGGSTTVTANVSYGSPVPNVGVGFTVTDGPDKGKTGSAITDANGNASFSFANNGEDGTDTIVAKYCDGRCEWHYSNAATVKWTTCELSQTIAGWEFQASCPDPAQLTSGVRNVRVTVPGGWSVDIPSGPLTTYALPLADSSHLLEPVVLPDLDLHIGPMQVFAYENTLAHSGVNVGLGGFDVPNGSGLVHDLHIGPGYTVSASSLEMMFFNAELSADNVHFSPTAGLTAAQFAVGLPGSVGGAFIGGKDLRIGADGSVSGTLANGELTFGEMAFKFSDAALSDNKLEVGSAELDLPPYLGGAKLHAEGLTYDFSTHLVSLQSAGGDLSLTLAGGRVAVDAHVDFKFKPHAGFHIAGSGSLLVGSTASPFFRANAAVDLESVDCDPAPPGGPCRNAAFLHQATLSIEVGRPIPLGQTGLGLSGLDGSVVSSQQNPFIDENGDIHGVTYTFGLGANFLTLADDGFVFNGHVQGSLSTNGNFGLAVDGTTFKYLTLHGGLCVRFVDVAGDPVCNNAITGPAQSKIVGQGIFVQARAKASLNYAASFLNAHASLDAGVFGRFVSAGGQSYIDASVDGTLSAGASSWLLPDVDGSGSIHADLGRFTTPTGGSTLGIKGLLRATLHTHSLLFGDTDRTLIRDFFIDQNGNYTDDNVAGYSQVGPSTSARDPHVAADSHSFSFTVRPGRSDTTFVLDGHTSTPSLTLRRPDGLRIIASVTPSGQQTLNLVPPPGRKLTRDDLASVYLVHLSIPSSVEVYLPRPLAGIWLAQFSGLTSSGFRFTAESNNPLPVLHVASPGSGITVMPTRARPWVHITGTLTGVQGPATVSVYAGKAGCVQRQGQLMPAVPGRLLISHVDASRGRWGIRWKAGFAPPARYVLYAVLENGAGPMVTDCSRGAIQVSPPATTPSAHLNTHASTAEDKGPRTSADQEQLAKWATDAAAACALATHPKTVISSHAEPVRNPKRGSDNRGHAAAVEPPIFRVTADRTPCIWANDAAAISLKDPLTGDPAITVNRTDGKYERYEEPAPDLLSYPPAIGKPSVDARHRREACYRPHKWFRRGDIPGPPDGKFNGKNQWIGGNFVSCDEYPFASTDQGGVVAGSQGAIIRGVLLAENRSQGGQFSRFLQDHAVDMDKDHSNGQFYVCVVGAGPGGAGVGKC